MPAVTHPLKISLRLPITAASNDHLLLTTGQHGPRYRTARLAPSFYCKTPCPLAVYSSAVRIIMEHKCLLQSPQGGARLYSANVDRRRLMGLCLGPGRKQRCRFLESTVSVVHESPYFGILYISLWFFGPSAVWRPVVRHAFTFLRGPCRAGRAALLASSLISAALL